MAYHRVVSALLPIALFFFTAANPSVHGGSMPMTHLDVSGQLCCTPNGNCFRNSEGVGGAAVHLNCIVRGLNVGVGLTTTNATGIFNIMVPPVSGLNFDLRVIPCDVYVKLPVSLSMNCSLLSTATGVLVSGLQPGKLVATPFGSVRYATISGFMKHMRG